MEPNTVKAIRVPSGDHVGSVAPQVVVSREPAVVVNLSRRATPNRSSEVRASAGKWDRMAAVYSQRDGVVADVAFHRILIRPNVVKHLRVREIVRLPSCAVA